MGRKNKNKQAQRNLNITVMILIVVSILLGVLIYSNSGYIGKNLSPALGGIMGYMKYLVPIGLFVTAIYIAYKKDTINYGKKVLMSILILILLDSVLASYQFSKGIVDISDGMNTTLSNAFELGTKDIGGGVVGTFVAFILIKLTGIVGSVIISVGISLILLVILFDLSPADMIANQVDKIAERKEQQKQEKINHPIESAHERREREKQEKIERRKKEKLNEKEPLDDQITINLQNSEKQSNLNDIKSKKGLEVPNFNDSSSSKFNHRVLKDEKTQEDAFTQEEITKEEKTKQVLNIEHALTVEDKNYEFPPIDLLGAQEQKVEGKSRSELLATAEKLRKTLSSFGVSAKVENVSVGPAITRYELAPAVGVRVNKIANLADDIALSLEAETIRIEAPIPGKHTVGIEVPNKIKTIVALRDIIESEEFVKNKSKTTFGLGKDVAGEITITDISKMPHLLIAGATGSGKSVCINTLVTSILYKAKPNEVKLLMIDPKVVELSVYNGIPHLLIPVVTDPKKAAGALQWAVQEMVNRYKLFADKSVRDVKGYNEEAEKAGEPKLPSIVIIIDELADLMMVAAKDVEDAICRLAQMARAAGMYLVIATQRPSVNVITGVIKANIPSRIAFAVSSQVDSRTILDSGGAEKLLGKGDMLFYPSGAPKPIRLQGAFVSDKEVENIVKFIKKDGSATYNADIIDKINNSDKENNKDERDNEKEDDDDTDPLLNEAIETAIDAKTASTSFIQRKFKVGYARAGRIIDQMESMGIISGYQGSKPREVLITKERWEELNMAPSQNSPSKYNNDDDNFDEENDGDNNGKTL